MHQQAALFYLIALIEDSAKDNSVCLEIQRAFKINPVLIIQTIY